MSFPRTVIFVCALLSLAPATHGAVEGLSSPKSLTEEQKTEVRRQFDPSTRLAFTKDGEWKGGGGEGVVCLGEDGREDVESADLAEYLGFGTSTNGIFHQPLPAESLRDFVHRVIGLSVEPGSPYLANRLRQAVALLTAPNGELNWSAQKNLPRIDDAGKRGFIFDSAKCRFVQLAVRYAKKTAGPFPQVFVDYDRDLVARLNRTSLGALLLHEALYLAGTELGASNSRGTRLLTALLMNTIVAKTMEEIVDPARRPFYVRSLFALAGFKNHEWLFVDPTPAPPGTAAHRMQSYARLGQKRLEVHEELVAEKIVPADSLSLLTSWEAKRLERLVPRLSEEEAFLDAVLFLWHSRQSSVPVDLFLMEQQEIQPALKQICSMVQSQISEIREGRKAWTHPAWGVLFNKALGYCRNELAPAGPF